MNSYRPVEPVKHVGEKLKTVRMLAKIKMCDLAKKSGISPSTISRIERGTVDVRLCDFVAICQVIGTSPNRILCGSEEWDPQEVAL